LNGDFVNRQSRHFAERLETEAGPDPGKQIEQAYLLALCRPVTPREKTEMLAFLEREAKQRLAEYSNTPSAADQAKTRREALQQMCRVIFNLNEFVYTD
jgi:hypothetical protein